MTNPGTQDKVQDGTPARAPAATVTVEGPGVAITRPVDEATLANVIALLFGASPIAAPGRPAAQQHQPQHHLNPAGAGQGGQLFDPELTLGEFLAETEAKSFPQKICAAGYYAIKLRGEESFDRAGIKAALVQAHEDMPGNYTRDFGLAASSNLIAEKPGEAGQFFVPTTGRKAVESHFQEVPKRRGKRTPRKASPASARNEE